MNNLLKYNSNGPFDPTFGGQPEITIGIHNEIEANHNFIDNLNTTWSLFITGLRGSGKTVFMNTLGHSFDKNDQYIVIDESNNADLINQLVIDLSHQLAQRIPQIKITNIDFSLYGIHFQFSRPEDNSNATSNLTQLIDIAHKHHYKIIFCIDEAANTPAIRELGRQFNKYKNAHYHVIFLMTGLPNEILGLANYHNLTFLLRSKHFWCDQLPLQDIANAYSNTLQCTMQEAEFFAQATKQYSYAFQELGALLYRYHNPKETYKDTYNLILPEYKSNLATHAYEPIWNHLSPNEQAYLISVTKSNRFSNIVKDLNKSSGTVNNYRTKLSKERLIQKLARGYVGFRLPFFQTFIKQKIQEQIDLSQFD